MRQIGKRTTRLAAAPETPKDGRARLRGVDRLSSTMRVDLRDPASASSGPGSERGLDAYQTARDMHRPGKVGQKWLQQ